MPCFQPLVSLAVVLAALPLLWVLKVSDIQCLVLQTGLVNRLINAEHSRTSISHTVRVNWKYLQDVRVGLITLPMGNVGPERWSDMCTVTELITSMVWLKPGSPDSWCYGLTTVLLSHLLATLAHKYLCILKVTWRANKTCKSLGPASHRLLTWKVGDGT